jgi:CRISPR-associated protein Cas2
MDAAKAREVKAKLEKLIDKEKDSLRFYNLGNNYKTKVEHIGAKPSLDLDGVITL